MPPAETSAFFPIRVVSNETGVNAITLRAWERRYGLLTPKRTEKGHRLYTEQDIALIKKVVTLLDRGIPISQAKAIIDSGADQSPRTAQSGEPSQWHQYLEQLTNATQQGGIGTAREVGHHQRRLFTRLLRLIQQRTEAALECSGKKAQLCRILGRGRLLAQALVEGHQ